MEKETKKRKPKKIEEKEVIDKLEQTSIKTKVTIKEYEQLYILHLKKNNLKNSLLNRKTFEIINKDKLIIVGLKEK